MYEKSDKTRLQIANLFGTLSKSEQADLMVSLYYSMDDYYKDRFLEETENA